MKRYKAVLFDLDGTLLDTSEGILHAFDETLAVCSLPQIPYERKRGIIGPPVDRSLREIYALDDEQTAAATAVFRDCYANKYLGEAVPYEGIAEVLRALRGGGIKTGVATYKRQSYALPLLGDKGLLPLFDCALGSSDTLSTKAEIIRACIERMGAGTAETAMVGDTVHDLTGAAAMGVDFVGVTYGFGFRTKEEILAEGGAGAAGTPRELTGLFL